MTPKRKSQRKNEVRNLKKKKKSVINKFKTQMTEMDEQ